MLRTPFKTLDWCIPQSIVFIGRSCIADTRGCSNSTSGTRCYHRRSPKSSHGPLLHSGMSILLTFIHLWGAEVESSNAHHISCNRFVFKAYRYCAQKYLYFAFLFQLERAFSSLFLSVAQITDKYKEQAFGESIAIDAPAELLKQFNKDKDFSFQANIDMHPTLSWSADYTELKVTSCSS